MHSHDRVTNTEKRLDKIKYILDPREKIFKSLLHSLIGCNYIFFSVIMDSFIYFTYIAPISMAIVYRAMITGCY